MNVGVLLQPWLCSTCWTNHTIDSNYKLWKLCIKQLPEAWRVDRSR